MKKMLFYFMFYCFTTQAAQTNKLTLYSFCPTQEDAMTCSNKCTKINPIQYEYEVNKSKNIVIEKTFTEEKLTNSSPLKNCKVIDEKNWECLSEDKSGKKDLNFSLKDKMVDGLLVHIHHTSKESNYMCAKK